MLTNLWLASTVSSRIFNDSDLAFSLKILGGAFVFRGISISALYIWIYIRMHP